MVHRVTLHAVKMCAGLDEDIASIGGMPVPFQKLGEGKRGS